MRISKTNNLSRSEKYYIARQLGKSSYEASRASSLGSKNWMRYYRKEIRKYRYREAKKLDQFTPKELRRIRDNKKICENLGIYDPDKYFIPRKYYGKAFKTTTLKSEAWKQWSNKNVGFPSDLQLLIDSINEDGGREDESNFAYAILFNAWKNESSIEDLIKAYTKTSEIFGKEEYVIDVKMLRC